MTSRERMMAALTRKKADRLPVTTHHIMPSFLKKNLKGKDAQGFFDHYGLDAIHWTLPFAIDSSRGEHLEPQSQAVSTPDWNIQVIDVPGYEYPTRRYSIVTPKRTLTTTMQSNEHTAWVIEHLVKEKSDVEIIAEFCPSLRIDGARVNREAVAFGERGIVRGHIPGFDIFGQPGTWQDASCLLGIENLIMACYDDPEWVHAFLKVLQKRKLDFVKSLDGTNYDILELGGGDASTTVISPSIFEDFVAPSDKPIVDCAHQHGQRIVYHTCGGMMPILEQIADMGVDAMETFTPPDMGGDADIALAKKRIGHSFCMIGGFDQLHFFTKCSPDQTRHEVRRLFEGAGEGGGFILSPSDHFFEAEPQLIEAFADEARKCLYDEE